MARTQSRSKKKSSGGRYHAARSKRKYELKGFAANTKLGELKSRLKRILGGNKKRSLLSIGEVNVADKKGKVTKIKILTVLENPANPNLVRRNVITKGAIVKTDLGKVRITSRPGQEGVVNGVLV
ncbi:MAG: 30S ribosomal protein S8e [Nanoarchaeota archaeon]|nr:30S ribosomal protein S8e [Nanoarchaeota archaeon]MBU1622402.1 30S ribosomal protein S8e [Nanoarchaeota archaeon]MBU1973824.1 30S ribosomal protein S8e [Nanoarchaeota archaeon]